MAHISRPADWLACVQGGTPLCKAIQTPIKRQSNANHTQTNVTVDAGITQTNAVRCIHRPSISLIDRLST